MHAMIFVSLQKQICTDIEPTETEPNMKGSNIEYDSFFEIKYLFHNRHFRLKLTNYRNLRTVLIYNHSEK